MESLIGKGNFKNVQANNIELQNDQQYVTSRWQLLVEKKVEYDILKFRII